MNTVVAEQPPRTSATVAIVYRAHAPARAHAHARETLVAHSGNLRGGSRR